MRISLLFWWRSHPCRSNIRHPPPESTTSSQFGLVSPQTVRSPVLTALKTAEPSRRWAH